MLENEGATESPIYNGLAQPEEFCGAEFLTVGELVVEMDIAMQKFVDMERTGKTPDTVFFLDKSARPAAYMIRKLFPAYCPHTRPPKIRFMNMGRTVSNPEYDVIDRDNDRPFSGDPETIKTVYGRGIKPNGNILVVDEIVDSGNTLARAKRALELAFPEARVEGLVLFSKMPRWFHHTDYIGVKERSVLDYKDLALELLRARTSDLSTDELTALETFTEGVMRDDRPIRLRRREFENDIRLGNPVSDFVELYWKIYDEVEGAIPYAKRAGGRGRVLFTSSRRELAYVCKKVLETKIQRELSTAPSQKD